MESIVDLDKVNQAIMHLSKKYKNITVEDIEKGVSILRSSFPVSSSQPKLVRLDQVKTAPATFFSTGEPWLDQWLANPRGNGGGVRLKEVFLMAGTPYAGKSHWLQWLTSRFALQGHESVYVFGEDLIDDVKDNLLIACKGDTRAVQRIHLLDMDGRFTVADVQQQLDELRAAGGNPTVVTLDHLDLMNPSSSHREDWRMAEEVVTDLKFMAKHNNVMALTASQRTFDTGGANGGMASLYRSRTGKAGNVDILLMIKDVYHGTDYNMGLEKARGRRVMTSSKTVFCDWSTMTIAEIAR